MDKYRVGDIIRISKISSNKLGITVDNLFTIERIYKDKVFLFYLDKELRIRELEAVSISDKLIGKIYLDAPIAAPIVELGAPAPMAPEPETLDVLLTQNEYLNIVKKYNIEYIHQLQHYLIQEIHHSWLLKIDRYFAYKQLNL